MDSFFKFVKGCFVAGVISLNSLGVLSLVLFLGCDSSAESLVDQNQQKEGQVNQQEFIENLQSLLRQYEKLEPRLSLTEKMEVAPVRARLMEALNAAQQTAVNTTCCRASNQQVEQEKASVSYIQSTKTELSNLVPVYAGNETDNPTGFGNVFAAALTQVNKESPQVKFVKSAVVNRLQEAHTRAVLGQSRLHIPEYTVLLNQVGPDAVVLETIQHERLMDEQAVEELANPSYWQMFKWWWKS
jgi:hypothetical protein